MLFCISFVGYEVGWMDVISLTIIKDTTVEKDGFSYVISLLLYTLL